MQHDPKLLALAEKQTTAYCAGQTLPADGVIAHMNGFLTGYAHGSLGLTESQIVEAAERIARRMAEFDGFHGHAGPYHTSENLRAQMYWRKACAVFDALNGTDPENAVQNLEN